MRRNVALATQVRQQSGDRGTGGGGGGKAQRERKKGGGEGGVLR